MKSCPRCGETKPLEDFHWRDRAKNRRNSHCKSCARKTATAWRAAHPDRQRANNQRYRTENREALLEHKRQKYRQDPTIQRESDRRYYEQHREQHWAYMRKWRAANPGRQAAYAYKRRAAGQRLESEDFEYIAILRRDPCSYCGSSADTIDHIQPISAGGSGGRENLTASCRRCNSRKRTTDLLRFLIRSS